MDEIKEVKPHKAPKQRVEPVEESDLSKLDYAVSMQPKIRIHWFPSILGWMILLAFSVIGLSRVGPKGARIYDLLGHPQVSAGSSKIWLKILSIHFSDAVISYPLYLCVLISIVMLAYYVLDAKTTHYNINFQYIEIKKGILNQHVDTIDLVKIKDESLDRPIHHRILGLSSLTIYSRDETHPELKMIGIDKHQAQLFLDFIRRNAYTNATEYWIAKDRRRRQEKQIVEEPEEEVPLKSNTVIPEEE